jgi:hypothetical protein
MISPKWTGFKAGWLESQTETYNIFRIDRNAAGAVTNIMILVQDVAPSYGTQVLQLRK